MTKINLAAVTMMGQKHRQRGVPCEDASIAISKNGVDVVVVADGAGSKQYTHARYGSECAVNTISELFAEHFDAIYNENREAAVRSLIIAALHIKFAELIEKYKLDSLERLSCTLLFCAVKDRRMVVGHIGDGLIAKVTPSGLCPITMPQNGTNASSTYFVTAAHAADYMRLIKTTIDDTHAVVLMTDGVQDSVYDENSGVVKPVIARMAETLSQGREKAEAELNSILEKYIVGASNNSDDSSFGVLYFEDTNAPDSKNLKASADAFPRGEETFKDLQNSLLPDVKKARKIIMEAQGTQQPPENSSEAAAPVKSGEVEHQEKEEKYEDVSIHPTLLKKNVILYSIIAAEAIAIVLLALKIIFG